MWRVYPFLVDEHDFRFVAIAVAICVIGSFTSATLLQRAATALDGPRRNWLILAGVVTGISIWTTHFTAMIGYAQILETFAATQERARSGPFLCWASRQRGLLLHRRTGLELLRR